MTHFNAIKNKIFYRISVVAAVDHSAVKHRRKNKEGILATAECFVIFLYSAYGDII